MLCIWFCLMTHAVLAQPASHCDDQTHDGVCQIPKKIVHVEMVADVVCPYCYIGLHRLQQAVQKVRHNPLIEVNISYTPFILRRHLPKAGLDKMSIFREQFGSESKARQVIEQVKQNAAADGLCFDPGLQRAGNSEDAHRLLHWARSWNKDLQLFQAMVKAYNCDRQWLGDHDVLTKCAEQVGLSGPEAAAALANKSSSLHGLESGLERARNLGVSGVPFFVIDGQQTMSGAVHTEKFLEIFRAKSVTLG
eukprot:gnl/MRDRNA2_/MRDRNA2_99840_c0_seq1.p1 gnl/MRDRNA2_/MRDRNA2_99840_c0~~gnl/MRDRNA2_/MRDRNA2_99840_c0_seq1.p1  ORF type:complete len:250 (+),score=40.05 gnl/MRDRNA2_/MRDRNA2_99840_c0_seq1:99-848(+)